MTEEEFRKIVREKITESNVMQIQEKVLTLIGEVYGHGLFDGFELAKKL